MVDESSRWRKAETDRLRGGEGGVREEGPAADERQRRTAGGRRYGRERLWKIATCICALVSLALAVALGVRLAETRTCRTSAPPRHCGAAGEERLSSSLQSRSSGDAVPAVARANHMYGGLSEAEFDEVVRFLLHHSDLNLTTSQAATLDSNYIYMIEDYLPNKGDALAYLRNRSVDAAPPARRVKAILFMGAARPAHVAEYIVSPVPHPTTLEPLPPPPPAVKGTNGSTDSRRPAWNARPLCDIVEGPAVRFLVATEFSKIKDILFNSFGQWVGNSCRSSHACLYELVMVRARPGSPDRRIFVEFYRAPSSVEGYYLFPVPLIAVLRQPIGGGSGPAARFELELVYYGGRPFANVEQLRVAYASGITKATLPPVDSLRGRYASPQRRRLFFGGGGDDSNLPANDDSSRLQPPRRPPTQTSPDGRRFTLNGRHVQYMGWSFNLHFRTVSGLALFDVRHGGEAVAYELSMQEIVVMYGGKPETDNFHRNFFDAGYSLGTLTYPLLRGIDCPADAVYVDSLVYALGADTATTMRDAACIFEHVNSVPLRRHYSGHYPTDFGYAFGMADSVLVVRQVMTIWNYDYIFDYEFHQNGVIDVRASPSGYVVVTPSVRDGSYGLPLSDIAHTVANVHGHYFHFKLDIDAIDERNSLTYIGIELEDTVNSLVDGMYKQMRLTQRQPATEREALVKYDFTRPKHFVVHSSRLNNSLGHRRGYRIHASGSFADVLLPPNNPQMRGASWALHQLAVTRRKETERESVSLYTQGDPSAPYVDFEAFYADNESVVDEDLVAWVTLGTHHVPCAEDLPVTTTPGRSLVASLVPFNFFDDDPSMRSSDAALFAKSEQPSDDGSASGGIRGDRGPVIDYAFNQTDECLLYTEGLSLRN